MKGLLDLEETLETVSRLKRVGGILGHVLGPEQSASLKGVIFPEESEKVVPSARVRKPRAQEVPNESDD